LGSSYPQKPGSRETGVRRVRNWRAIDVGAFADDLCRSEQVVSAPDDAVDAFICYDQTLRTLLDQHAPPQLRVRTRPSASWYDADCRDAKRRTRRLERKYRRRRMAEALAAWRQQSEKQRQLCQRKFTTFWLTTVDSCRRNPYQLWHTVNSMLLPPKELPTPKLTSVDFAQFFRKKGQQHP